MRTIITIIFLTLLTITAAQLADACCSRSVDVYQLDESCRESIPEDIDLADVTEVWVGDGAEGESVRARPFTADHANNADREFTIDTNACQYLRDDYVN